MSNSTTNYVEDIYNKSEEFSSPIDFIKGKQDNARTRLKELGFPTKSSEDWKYYDFKNILEATYELNYGYLKAESKADAGLQNKYKELVSRHVYPETLDSLLVTVNGAYSPELSSFDAVKDGLNILNFNDPNALEANSEAKKIVEEAFAKDIDQESNFFKAINTALMTNGFLLDIKDNFVSEKTLQVLHISNTGTFNQTRSLIHAGKNSELKIVVNYVGIEDAKYFTNAVIEVLLEDNAKLKLDKIQSESKQATQMYHLNAELKRDSNFTFNSFTFGAAVSRDDVNIDVNGEGAHAEVNGLYVLTEEKRSHNHIVMNHNAANSTSSQVFKGLLYNNSRAEFNGIVNVKQDAQQISADQLNKNLLMSETAHVDTRPQLNIYADDVKCSHGATVGQLEEDSLFYLQSRGLDKQEAITMLTYSFCEELIKNIDLESARDAISKLAVSTLNQGLIPLLDEPVSKQCLN